MSAMRLLPILLAAIVAAATPPAGASDDLPVDRQALERLEESSGGRHGLTNLLSVRQIYDAVRDGGASGLEVDFSHVAELLDGTKLDAGKLYGSVLAGPYPFESRESRFTYKRFRIRAALAAGKARIDVPALLEPRLNSEGWTDRGQLAVRFILFLEGPQKDRELGTYDTVVAFEKTRDGFARRPGIIEGPFVNLVSSDAPGEAVISFVTHESVRARVVLEDPAGRTASFWDEWARERHEIPITGLRPGERFTYRVEAGSTSTRSFELRAAPRKSRAAAVRFAYFGDSRAGEGGGLASYMGVNYTTLERLARIAHAGGAEFFIVGGDLVSGYTTVRDDFEAQLHAWKQAVTGFWNERPIYAGIGNHEALLRRYTTGLRIDRWPYDTESAEAVFARVFVHPRNGPLPADPRRPTYRENVYSFHYGGVKLIAFNNNYWFSDNPGRYGGSPEGYLMDDQLEWLVAELDGAEADPEVRHVILFAQEPVFPNGGHIGDAMWHGGDNRVRAHVYRDGKVLPEEDGIIAVRNRLVRAVAARRKVAAVLGSDEHAYHRVLIGPEVPIGDIERDDRNRNGRIDVDAGETASPLGDLRRRTWYLVCGGGGAPYYAGEKTPWNEHWRDRTAPRSGLAGYFYTSQENVLLFDAGEKGIGVRVYNPHGELIDEIPDLTADRE
jgi:hypothetical protein